MRKLASLLLLLVPACSSGEAAPEPRTAVDAPAAALPPAPVTEAAPAPAPAPEPPLDAAAQKKKEEQAKLVQDIATMEADAKKEAERFTPELKAEVKALAEASYPDVKAGLSAAMKGKYRVPGNADRDVPRHFVETMTFFGMKPTMTVLEIEPGGGWCTELLAPVLAKKGKLIVTNTDPAGPADQRATLYGKRLQRFIEKSSELSGKIEVVVIDPDNPKFGHEGQVDVVLSMRQMHNWVRFGRFDKTLAAVNASLKKGGVFGVEEHRAKADAVPEESAKKGYLPEAWLIQKVEAAGFKLAGKSEINANAKDTKDYEEGVWTLPPTLRLKDKDRAKYVAIGESDRMTLKFVKR